MGALRTARWGVAVVCAVTAVSAGGWLAGQDRPIPAAGPPTGDCEPLPGVDPYSEFDHCDVRFLKRLEATTFWDVGDPGVTAFNGRVAVCANLRNGYDRKYVEADFSDYGNGVTSEQIKMFIDMAIATYPDCSRQ